MEPERKLLDVGNFREFGRKLEVSARIAGTERNCVTGWRWTQSRANFSPAKFPANREIYRESPTFGPSPSEINPLQRVRWKEKLGFRDQSEQGMIRGEQGIKIP
jgi:hypothetical protein